MKGLPFLIIEGSFETVGKLQEMAIFESIV